MKKLFISIFILCLFLTGCDNSNNTDTKNTVNNQTSNSQNEYSNVSKLSTEIEVKSNNFEEEIGIFSTKIYDKDKNRQHNLELTCSKINNFILKSGQTFSFCDTVGKATKEAGYKKAKIFDDKGNILEGYGRSEIAK